MNLIYYQFNNWLIYIWKQGVSSINVSWFFKYYKNH
jgi:hypothetical protein